MRSSGMVGWEVNDRPAAKLLKNFIGQHHRVTVLRGYGVYPLSACFRELPARLRRLNHNSGSTIDFINLSTLPVQHIEYANPPCHNRTPKSNPAPKKPLSPFRNAIDLISLQLRVNSVCLNRGFGRDRLDLYRSRRGLQRTGNLVKIRSSLSVNISIARIRLGRRLA